MARSDGGGRDGNINRKGVLCIVLCSAVLRCVVLCYQQMIKTSTKRIDGIQANLKISDVTEDIQTRIGQCEYQEIYV